MLKINLVHDFILVLFHHRLTPVQDEWQGCQDETKESDGGNKPAPILRLPLYHMPWQGPLSQFDWLLNSTASMAIAKNPCIYSANSSPPDCLF